MPSTRLLASVTSAVLLLGGLPSAHAAVQTGEKTHVVGKGDTLVRIAKRYRVSVDALREANDLRPRELLHPGLSLVIPGKNGPPRPPAPAKGRDRDKRTKGKEKEPAAVAEPEVKGKQPEFHGPRRRGYVRIVRGTEKIEIQLTTRHGRVAPNALASFSHMLRSSSGAKLAIDPRLASLVAQVSEHFGGRPLHVVSGFRPYSPVQYTAHSNHNLGRAMDFAVEGVTNTTLRDYCRGFRDAGVGFYPNSTFVHLDVRTGKAYWIDYARPGEPPRYDASTPRPKGDPSGDEPEAHTGVGGESDPDNGSQ